MKQHITHVIIVVSALALTACGQGMNSGNGGKAPTALQNGQGTPGGGGGGNTGGDNTGGGNTIDTTIDFEAIQAKALADAADAEAAAEAAAQEAEKALNKISLGNGGVSFGNSGDMDQQLIVDKLVKKILDKVLEGLNKIPSKFDLIRGKLADAMSKLDASNPLHQRGIDALMVAMAKVDMVEAKYKDILGMLADKVDFIGSKLDLLAAAVPFPANILVQFELSSVKAVLAEFKNAVKNL